VSEGRRGESVSEENGDSLRIVQVGLGGFGLSWASTVLPSVPGVRLVACVDVDSEALEKAAAATGLPKERMFSSLGEALGRVEADAVLITASLGAHVPVALEALGAGKHVLTEKPFAPSLAEAQSVVDLARKQDLVMMVSQNYRFFPAVRAVAALVQEGTYGSLDAVHIDFRRFDNSAPRGGHRHYHFPEPMVVDMAIHHFDLMRLVLGREPVEIYCRSWNPAWSKFDEPAEAMSIVRFEGDVMVSYRGSWLSGGTPTPWAGEWRMELSGGEIAWTSRDGTPIESSDAVAVRVTGEECAAPVHLPTVQYVDRAGSLDAFARAVRSGDQPETSGAHNLKTLALTLAAVESAETGRPVMLEAPRLET
jgi:predicted dehydrogenase